VERALLMRVSVTGMVNHPRWCGGWRLMEFGRKNGA
jgi:hypothetical protein